VTSVDPNALSQSLRRLSRREEAAPTLVDSLQEVIDACVRVFGVDGSGLMLADEHIVLRYVVASDGPGRALEHAQLDLGEGPCVTTFVDDVLVRSADVGADARWPALARRMRGSDVVAVLGVPVHLNGLCVGSLDIYRSTPWEWSDEEAGAMRQYGRVVDSMLAAAVSAEQAGQLAGQLGYALDYRVPIERGVGYLMARDSVDSIEAFHRLRSAARSSRRKVGDVAADLLRTGLLPGEQPLKDRRGDG
jgi:hypothetical protein